jgi:hypothetical protein
MLIKQLFSQNAHWQINKDFARVYGLEAAILISDLVDKWIYFECNEWFFNTSENIERDTTLSYHKQKEALKILVFNGFIETSLQGIPAKLHFKIIESKILNFFNTGFKKTSKQDVKEFNTNKNKVIRINNNNKDKAEGSANFIKMKEVYFNFYESLFNFKPTFQAIDGKMIKEIEAKIINICNQKELNITEKLVVGSFTKVLDYASKDKWLKENFLLKNINSQFNKIINYGTKQEGQRIELDEETAKYFR